MESLRSLVLDIDGCLVSGANTLTIPFPTINSAFSRMMKQGVEIHLNSNRSLHSILEWYEPFNLNGHIVAERGAYVFYPQTGESKSFHQGFDSTMLFSLLDEHKINYVTGENISLVFKKPGHIAKKYAEHEDIVFVETDRKYNMILFTRKVENGTLVFDHDLNHELEDLFTPHYPLHHVKAYDLYCGVEFVLPHIEKGNLMHLAKKPVASFGDTLQDWSMLEKSDFMGCPSNAGEALKERVSAQDNNGFVSQYKYTRGLLDFFKYLQKQGVL
ncbi:hypothetical protein COT72_01630 [archaeon CG10_big_fil_rev_8_21_14_0_10_43_11]|nr:MAG: hypothetical protein COT72_01630 [archaeon CG10_big_fil_rev_8_21_14_0_10_43_11]